MMNLVERISIVHRHTVVELRKFWAFQQENVGNVVRIITALKDTDAKMRALSLGKKFAKKGKRRDFLDLEDR